MRVVTRIEQIRPGTLLARAYVVRDHALVLLAAAAGSAGYVSGFVRAASSGDQAALLQYVINNRGELGVTRLARCAADDLVQIGAVLVEHTKEGE